MYSEQQIKNAMLMKPFVRQDSPMDFWVPKRETLKILKLNPNMKFDKKYYDSVIGKSGEKPYETFHCTCVWGTYRDSRDEPNAKYCAHILAVIFKLVKDKILPESWANIILKGVETNEK